MKKLNLILAIIVAFSFSAKALNEVTVTGATGIVDGTGYLTLAEAISAIGTSQTGNNISVAINASTTEPDAGISIGAGDWSSLTIYPTGDDIVITATTPAANLITFNGADNVTIDGSKNHVGTNRNLTITSPATVTYATIAFTAIAQSNTVKNCTIKGSVDGAVGLILFGGTAAAANGNGLNTIDNNLITNAGIRPRMAIYAPGSTANPTVGNKITNNEFKDIINTSIASPAYIFIGGGATATSSNWTITGNSFYETSPLTMTYSTGNTTLNFVQLGTTTANFVGNDNNISDNYFGGTAKQCGGGTYTLTSAAGRGTIHSGIYLCTIAGGTNSIQNNTFQKISWTNKIGSVNWRAIDVYGAGSYDIGTITGNTIGDNTTTESIVFTTDVSTAVSCSMIPIQITTTGNVAVKNNKIGSLKATNTLNTNPAIINAIVKNTAAGTVDVRNNIIGSTTTANSIYNTITTSATSEVAGIKIYSNVAGNIISNNTIANLTTGGNTSLVEAIFIGGPGSGGVASGTTTFTINANLIHSIFSSSNSLGAQVTGIYINNYVINATCTNNIISLSSNVENQVCGFLEQTYASGTNLYHNTVYISGTAPSGSRRTAGIWSNATGAQSIRDYKNNVFFNARVNGGTASGSNACVNIATTTGGTLNCNFNDLYSATPAAVGVYNNGNKTFAVWQATAIPVNGGTYLPDVNSKNLDPSFGNAGGTLAEDYKPSSAVDLACARIATVLVDYANINRDDPTKMGAYQTSFGTKLIGNEIKNNITVISNSIGILVPLATESIIELYNINGSLIDKTKTNGSYSRALNNGMYIIKVNGKAIKFVK